MNPANGKVVIVVLYDWPKHPIDFRDLCPYGNSTHCSGVTAVNTDLID